MSADASSAGRGQRPFRWQALLQNASEAVFVLDRRRRLLFVNPAWQALTGLSADRARGLFCRRPRPVLADAPLEDLVAHILTPPPEALRGAFSRARRLFHHRPLGEDDTPPHSPQWWDVEFFPLRQSAPGGGHLILGRIMPVPAVESAEVLFLPERLASQRQRRIETYNLDRLASSVPAMQRLLRQVRLASAVADPALLVGEAGTGKETVARVIHYLGPDRECSFAALDCKRLPASAVLAVLIPDDAARALLGAVYLRQPECLPREVQQRIADWLADGEGAPVPRLFAGCLAPQEALRAGRLLPDLYWLLSPLTLEVPPLRERKADLPRLVGDMLAAWDRSGHCLTPAAWEVLRFHDWPGNLTELRRALATAVAHAGTERIDATDLPMSLRLARQPDAPSAREPALPLERLLEQAERRIVELALRRARGNRTRAAELLGVHRARLLRRLDVLGVEPGEARLLPAEDEPPE